MGWPAVVPVTVGTVLHVGPPAQGTRSAQSKGEGIAVSPGRADSRLLDVGAPGYVGGRVADVVAPELPRDEGVFIPVHPAHTNNAVRTTARQRLTLQLCTLDRPEHSPTT